jgi:hypothetical protein
MKRINKLAVQPLVSGLTEYSECQQDTDKVVLIKQTQQQNRGKEAANEASFQYRAICSSFFKEDTHNPSTNETGNNENCSEGTSVIIAVNIRS